MHERHPSLTTSPVAPDALTARQREVVALIAEGLTNAEIGQRLGVTPGTAANHVDAVLRRLRASGRVQAAVWAIAHGLVRVQVPRASDGSADGTAEAAL